ncbi:SOS response associated peptidase (SRAP) domain-containing protein [Ditylenchus destructor]|uniref:Abasic site processing protein HMCES n=1 Tax=Ditylenchus destructor TaxID=166010 RepID=A0AAD4NCN2_9BILA|nr:SOS response associated peptidase (SRAP) domain-containing protein [Ditylenchus destructor]
MTIMSTLAPQQLCKACSGNPNRQYPGAAKWRDVPGGVNSYRPSYNLAPTVYSPILVSGHHFATAAETQADAQPMHWGLVPSYHKGEPKQFRYSTINARAEGILDKQTYRVPLTKGNRCVVLADGFYEWKRVKNAKQPYFIYFLQRKEIAWDRPEDENGGPTWNGRRLLTMAGIFEVNKTGEYPLYSYTIITVNASKKLSSIHDRMPALLDGDEAVDMWLDTEHVSLEKALSILKPIENVCYHPVTVSVGNVRYQGPECVLHLEEEKPSSAIAQPQTNTLETYFHSKKAKKEEFKTESD